MDATEWTRNIVVRAFSRPFLETGLADSVAARGLNGGVNPVFLHTDTTIVQHG
jgi:hypothetical protein